MESKYFFIMFLVIGAFELISGLEIPEHLKKHAERLHNKCQAETGVAEELIAQSQNGNLPDDRNLQCYINCLFQTAGLIALNTEVESFEGDSNLVCGSVNAEKATYKIYNKNKLSIDEDNIIHLEHIIDILPTEIHEVINNLVNTCGTKHGADPCETAYLTVKCYFDADPLHSMLI